MQLQIKTDRQGINKAYLKVNVKRNDIDAFKNEATTYLNNLEQAKGKDEEHLKGYLSNFIRNAFYDKENRLVQTGGGEDKIDLCIYKDSSVKSGIEVIFETKLPSNSTQMISKERPNAKALHQAIHYYFEEREAGNEDLKQVIITNYYEFFFFDAQEIERNFYSKKSLVKTFRDWQSNLKVSRNKPFMYGKFEEYIADSEINLNCISLNLKDYKEHLVAMVSEESDKKLIPVYKLFSPQHLVKKPFANDSNSLNRGFYNELLYILGLVDVKEKKVGMLIKRLPEAERQRGSLIENTIEILLYDQHMGKLRDSGIHYGVTEEEKQFSVALELVITWMNRILFLKLMEAQLLSYHQHDEKFKFLDFKTIDEYDELEKLFFRVLALRNEERPGSVQDRFGHIPYLNSSLFDATKLEDLTTRISGLDDKAYLKLYPKSILKKSSNPPDGKLKTLDYLLQFLDAYNFSAESSGGVQTEDKALINASVLGLIFEKINGYKDGSFFTPGFITEYMARETLRKSVTEKLNEAFNWDCKEFSELHRKIEGKPLKEVNDIINSITVCDPAVGSGHFLVSCLNELIAIKSELKILCDHTGKRIPYLDISVENDELAIEHEGELFEYKLNHEWNNGKVSRKPAGKERQRIQEALFHEKRYLIENCLFGVDINPNSVKICRLRLWIELLKNAYYRSEENYLELEVLPNIDINIKQGNSLVSRFGLDEDLSKIFKKSKHSLKDYKQAVRTYRETRDRNEKQRLQQLINDIKAEYSQNLINNKPINQKLSKVRGKLDLMMREDLFGGKKATKKELKEQQQKVDKLEQQKAEEEAGAFYREAFEWRFEFPEVLDKLGSYKGFDVIIGNPPYVFGRESFDELFKEYLNSNYETAQYQLDLYVSFMELGVNILKADAFMSFITPNSWLKNITFSKCRKFLLENSSFYRIAPYLENVFEDASVDSLIFISKKSRNSSEIKIDNYFNNEIIFHHKVNQNRFYENDKFLFDPHVTDEISEILKKIENETFKMEEFFNITRGVNAYDSYRGQSKEVIRNRAYHSEFKEDNTYVPELKGKHVQPFYYHWTGNSYISYGEWLAAPRDPVFFNGERIILRQVTGKRLFCSFIDENFIIDQTVFIAKPKVEKQELNLKFIAGLISSKPYIFYFKYTLSEFDDLFPKVKIGEFKNFPIFIPTIKKQNYIAGLVSNIFALKKENPKANTSELEAKIDSKIYELYGLSNEEIGVVEKVLKVNK